MIKLVVDSTCNLSPETLKKYDIGVAPIAIQFGNETFEEGINIDRDLFYRKIDEMGIIPTSSQPSPARFKEFYEELSGQDHSILVITVTGKHSGTYDSAILAQDMVPSAEVEVFDSLSLSIGTGWMVLEAAQAIEAGQTMDQIVSRLNVIRDHTLLYFTPATLKYLQMSGRVGRLQGAIGSLLNVKPIIYVEEGVLEAKENVRTRSKSRERILELIEEGVGTEAAINLGVIHARAPEDGQQLLSEALARFNCKETLIVDLVPSLAVHGGPGIIGLSAYPV